MRALVLPILLAVVTTSACVSTGTYDELLMSQERTKKELVGADLIAKSEASKRGDVEAQNTSLGQALNAEKARNAAAAAATEQKLAATQAELKKTSDDLATTIKDRAGLKSSVEDMKSALDELSRRKAESDKRIAEYKNLLSRFQSLIDSGKLKVKIVDGRMVVALAADILFASGSAALSKEGKASVDEVAAVLSSIPDRKFQVEGHTDNVPIKTAQFPSNWELAAARSLTVLKSMVDAGLPADRVSAASFGESKPAVPNTTPEQKAANRRIEIVVVPDLSTLPGFDELQKVK
jgi:chemotaxis protein MotB